MEIKDLVNLTPHEITIVGEDGKVRAVIPPSGQVARVKTEQAVVRYVDNIPVVKSTISEIEGLPHKCDNCILDCFVEYVFEDGRVYSPDPKDCDQNPLTYYIVSSLVAQVLSGKRNDLLAPDTSPNGVVRDSEGRIIGVKRFQRW